jgi:hypothetical protein
MARCILLACAPASVLSRCVCLYLCLHVSDRPSPNQTLLNAPPSPHQTAEAAREAAALYQLFLDSFKLDGPAASGQLPATDQAAAAAAGPQRPPPDDESAASTQLLDRLDADNEAHAVRAAFHAGCMLNTAMRLEGEAGRGGGMGGARVGPAAQKAAARR